ncbi:uncharacterized protein J3D65DRAFT_623241 [Phyllosticta citribraziliensis]|uniref:Apc15p protein-domain-containing protein n=1 Tax=Phyllosticta citribraziliensis TaxID=989973 RepID=A0ABR1LUI8_9PEZI
MLSLPPIIPREDLSAWHSSPHLPSHSPPPQNNLLQQLQERPNGHPHRNRRSQPTRSAALAALVNDENIIEQRKLNVRRFGAGWLRPPGIAKTFQAAEDEALEREEQEILAQREAAMMDLANAQEQREEEMRRREMIERGAAEEEAAAEPHGGDQDLDAEVPDLDADIPEGGLDDSDDEDDDDEDDGEDDDDEEEEEDDDGEDDDDEEDNSGEEESEDAPEVTEMTEAHDVTFNEESMYGDASLLAEDQGQDLEDAQQWVEREEAEMAGDLQDERDLDDEIMEAGSYEHTDTELEEESTINESAHSIHIDSSELRSSNRLGQRTRQSQTSGNANSNGSDPFRRSRSSQQNSIPSFNLNRGTPRGSFLSDGPSSLLGDGTSLLSSSPNAGRGRGNPSWMQPPPRPDWRRG